jgi:hypothetical protein
VNFLPRLLALAVLLLPLGAQARSVPFPKENFVVEVPREWNVEKTPKVKASWGRLVLTATGPEGRFLVVGVQDMPGADRAKAEAHLRTLQEPALKQEWKVSEIRETLIDSVPFYLFMVTRKGLEAPDILLAVTFTKNRAYTLQLGDPKGGVDEVEDLDKLLRSFRLLTPMTPLQLQMAGSVTPPVAEPGLRVRWVVAGVLGVGLLVGVVQWWLGRAARKRRRRRRKQRAEAEASGGEPAPPAA